MPARSPHPRHRQRGGRGGGDAPARDRGGRDRERVRLLARVALQQQRDRAAALRRELKPASGGHRSLACLTDHGAKGAVPQPFLHQCEHFRIVRRLGVEDAFRREPRLEQPRREQVAPAHDPQHRSPCTRGNAGEEQGRRRVVAGGRGSGRDLVQGVEPQPLGREFRVDRTDAKGQHRPTPVPRAFDGGQLIAQRLEDSGVGHGS